MHSQEIRTRFGTYECTHEQIQLVPDDFPPLLRVATRPKSDRPPPWSPARQQQINRLHELLPHEYGGHSFEPRTFQTLVREVQLPSFLRSSWVQQVHPDYLVVLQLSGLLYDLCRTIRPLGEVGLREVHRGLQHHHPWVTSNEWELLLLMVQLYYEATTSWSTSTRRLAELIASRSGVELYRVVRATAIAHEGPGVLLRFQQVGWYLELILNTTRLPRQISRRVQVHRSTTDSGRKLRLIPLTPHNLATLIEDPVSSFARPVELGWRKYLHATGRTKLQLRQDLVDLLLKDLPPVTTARDEIYNWYRSDEVNRLSRRSLEDLVERLARHPRPNWDEERIMMTARRLSSINYDLEDLIHDYDREHLESQAQERKTQIEERLAPLVPCSTIQDLTSEQAFRIPILSPRGLLLIYGMLKGEVPPWFDRLLASSIRSVVGGSIDFPGLYGNRYGIDGLITTNPDSPRVILVDRS